MSDSEQLAATLRQVAQANMKPKELIAAVRQRHPEATKKQIVRAAFYALTQDSHDNREQDQQLHEFALAERAIDEETPVVAKVRKKGRRKLKASGQTPEVRSAPLG